MPTNDNDTSSAPRARRPLAELRQNLLDAKTAEDPVRLPMALADVLDGLIAHAQQQSRAIDDMRSDMTHKQGIVTRIGGGDFHEPAVPEQLREFASSQNGDRWLLGRNGDAGIAHVVHKANEPSGGASTRIELGDFLHRSPGAPEVLGLLRLIGTLVA